MAISTLQRPFFYEGQYLGATDLTAVVDYGRLADARHLLGAHTWGIGMGLQLIEKPLPGGSQMEVYIQPGYAWDGFGRPIVVLSPYKLPAELFRSIRYSAALDQSGTGRLIEICLRYDEAEAARVRQGFEVCNQENQFTRLDETFLVEIGPQDGIGDQRSALLIDGRSVDAAQALRTFDPAAPLVYDTSVPHQALPEADEPARWLIPIGYVRWQPVQNGAGYFVARDDTSADKDSDKIRRFRHYIGVVAEAIQAADGALRLRSRGKDPATSYFQAPTNDLVWVEGNLRTEGDVRIAGGTLDFRSADGQDFNAPLRIQRSDAGSLSGPNALQLLLGRDSQTNNRLAVGLLKANDTVDEKFVILSGGNVGIGTNTPITKLEIVGDWTGEEGNLRLTGDKPTIRFTGGAVAGNESWSLHLGSNGPGNLEFFKRTGAQKWENILSLTPAGNVGIGTTTPVSTLQIGGDVTLQKQAVGAARVLPAEATMLWNDGTWLRLNQNLDFSKPVFGVHTPGLFAPVSLNVGGAGNWGDPGPGNVWISGRLGIGTTTPQARLQVSGGTIMPAVGNSSAAGIQFPSDPGGGAGDEAFIRYFVEGGETTKLLIGCQNDANDTIGFFQFGQERLTIRAGNIGIGKTAPTVALDVNGSLTITGSARRPGGGAWTNSSDTRLKKNIEPLDGALDKMLQLHGVRFEWREPQKMGNQTGSQIGLVAQEVEAVFPDWISEDPKGYKEITIRGFEALTVEAMRALKAEVDHLAERFVAYEAGTTVLQEQSNERANRRSPARSKK